jgi:hypothetical protein
MDAIDKIKYAVDLPHIWTQYATEYASRKIGDNPRGEMSNIEVIKIGEEMSLESTDVYIKGFSFYEPSKDYMSRWNAEGTTKFNILGSYAKITFINESQPNSRFAEKTKTAYFIGEKIHKMTKLSMEKCLTVGLGLSSISLHIPSPSFLAISNENRDIDKSPMYKLQTPPPAPISYSKMLYDNQYSGHVFEIDFSSHTWFEKFLSLLDYEVSDHAPMSFWLLDFYRILISKNIIICNIKNILGPDILGPDVLGPTSNFKILTNLCEEYCQSVHILNRDYIFKYFNGLGYIYMNYFANILKFPYESNISTTFLLYFLKPEIYIKSAQEYYNSIFNLENIEKLDISPEEKKELISSVEKDNNSKNKSFFKTLGLRLGISGGIFGGSFGILTLVNRWYKYKKENILKLYPGREKLLDLIAKEASIHPNFNHYKYIVELLKESEISPERIDYITKKYINKPNYTFLPNSIDYALSATIYGYFLEKLIAGINYVIFNWQKFFMEKSDQINDTGKVALQQGITGALLTGAASGVGMVVSPGITLTVITKGLIWAQEQFKSSGGYLEKVAGFLTNNMVDTVKFVGLGLIGMNINKIINILFMVIYFLSPFFLIPIISRAVAAVRINSQDLYTRLVKSNNNNKSTKKSPKKSPKKTSIEHGEKIFKNTLKNDLHQEITNNKTFKNIKIKNKKKKK